MLIKAQREYWEKPENKIKQSEKVKKFFIDHPQAKEILRQKSTHQWANKNLRIWRSKKTSEQWTEEFREKRGKAYNQTYLHKGLQTLSEIYLKSHNVDKSEYENIRKEKNDKSLLKYETIRNRFFDGDEKKFCEAIINFNHRIKKMVPLEQEMDVYDLEVEQTHNFALSSGIFVHNSAKQGRDRRFQAILPVGGKILNTERAQLDKIVQFEELKDLIIALGMGIGETLNIEKLRYHRIILMCDADVDGEHINTLLLTFFFRHLRPVIDNGYLYLAMPPLFRIQSGKEVFYAYNDQERDKILARFTGKNVTTQRYKGLGEMNPDQLWETTMNPESRMLKQINIRDAAETDQVFTMLMGEEVPPRKRFIQTHANTANIDI